MIWVDVGGGTARNLEFFPLDTLRQHFSHIYIVDVSHSLLEASYIGVAWDTGVRCILKGVSFVLFFGGGEGGGVR